MSPNSEHVCAQCRHAWPKGQGVDSECPKCGRPLEPPAGFRFRLRDVLILGVLCLAVLVAVATGRGRRPAAAPSAEPTDSGGGSPAEPAGRSKVGSVPCGYCNGDGRLDDADLYKRTPPRINAPPGPCPVCVGRGGLSK